MLHFIRERAQGWVAWLIVGLITIPFALWGVNSYITGASDIVVATVDGDDIKQTEFQRAMQKYRDRMRQAMAGDFDPSLFDNTETKRRILNSLIEEKLLLSAAQSLGQTVADSHINQIIRGTEAFQTDGKFDSERYRMQLARAGFSPASYENQLRIDLMTQQLTGSIRDTAIVTEVMVENLLRLEKQKRIVDYGTVAAAPLAADITVTEDDKVLYYQDHKHEYVSPERMSVNFVELSVDELAKEIDVKESELKQYYMDNKRQFMTPEQRKLSHILITGENESALSTMSEIEQRLQQGETFSALAKAYSADTESATKGGDLGVIELGVMESSFEDVAYSLENVGDVSEPVKTEFGYHLIKLTGIVEPEGQSFADVRDEIIELYKKQRAEKLFYDQAETLADMSYENPESLDVVAHALDLTIKTTDFFNRKGGEGIAANSKVIEAAYSDEVLNDDLNSPVIELTKTHLVVLHKKQYVAESQLPYDVVSAAIEKRIKAQRARSKARENGEKLIDKLKSGASAEKLFAGDGWQQNKVLSRTDENVNSELRAHAYAMARPDNGPVYSGFTASNGNYIVVRLNKVIDGDVSQADDSDKTGLVAYLSRYNGDNEFSAFIASLREQAEIKIKDKRL